MRVESLHIYPVKSARGIDLKTSPVEPRGLAGDRRWMIVGADGRFITQREFPKLATLQVLPFDGGITLQADGLAVTEIHVPGGDSRLDATVWRDTVNAAFADNAAVLSAWMERDVRLVYMDDQAARSANPKYTIGKPQSPVSFADGYPVLITNTASLRALNALILSGGGAAVPMSRFRPNIVIDSDQAWAEDDWKTLTIGEAVLELVKPCTRCVMTTLDQASGEKQGREPLQALRTLRTSTDPEIEGVLFGWNAVVRAEGSVTVGDAVELMA